MFQLNHKTPCATGGSGSDLGPDCGALGQSLCGLGMVSSVPNEERYSRVMNGAAEGPWGSVSA